MPYKRDLNVRSSKGETRIKAEDRSYPKFTIFCPKCGKKMRFDVTDASEYNLQKQPGYPFWHIDCKNSKCQFSLA